MFAELKWSLPVFFLSIFGILHLSELGFYQSTAQLASFEAARSQFVDDEGKGWGRQDAKKVVHDARTTDAEVTFDEKITTAKVKLHYPGRLPRFELTFDEELEIAEKMPIPQRGSE
jgi:hypothetical protein